MSSGQVDEHTISVGSASSAPGRQTEKNVRTNKTEDDDRVQDADELRAQYKFDYSRAKPNRFADRLGGEAIAVVLDPDVAAVFTTSEEANQALRVLIGALGNLAETPDLLEKVKSSTAPVASSRS